MWQVDLTLFERGGPAWALWDLPDGLHGIGWVTANKLIARKRPRLVPVYDTVVQDALRPGPNLVWDRLWHCLDGHVDIRDELASIRADAGGLEDISLLRILDVVVWMRFHGDAQVDDEH